MMNLNKVMDYIQCMDRILGEDGEVYEMLENEVNITYLTEDDKYAYTLNALEIVCIAKAIKDIEDDIEIFKTIDKIVSEILNREFASMRETNVISLSAYRNRR